MKSVTSVYNVLTHVHKHHKHEKYVAYIFCLFVRIYLILAHLKGFSKLLNECPERERKDAHPVIWTLVLSIIGRQPLIPYVRPTERRESSALRATGPPQRGSCYWHGATPSHCVCTWPPPERDGISAALQFSVHDLCLCLRRNTNFYS